MQTEDPQIPLSEAAGAVESMTRRVALLYLAFARTLVEALGEEAGREMIQKAVWDYGRRIGEETRARVEAQGLEPTPENFGRGSDLPPIGFKGESVVVDGETRSRVYGCVLARVFREAGEAELGDLYCGVDPAKMQAYDPQVTITHTKKVLRGDACCEMATRWLDEPPKA